MEAIVNFISGSYSIHEDVVGVSYKNGEMILQVYFGQDNLAKEYIDMSQVQSFYLRTKD